MFRPQGRDGCWSLALSKSVVNTQVARTPTEWLTEPAASLGRCHEGSIQENSIAGTEEEVMTVAVRQ
jgi:hypothetical protein